jgi:FkbM family methyltransferase
MTLLQRLIQVTQRLWKPFPTPWLVALVRRVPKLAVAIPPGRTVIFHSYLGDLNVVIDTTYPMERKMLSGIYEPSTLQVIHQFVSPGAYCLDIGANVGPITLALAKHVGETGRVYAFEPGPPIFQRLEQNVRRNSHLVPRIHLYNSGLSEAAGTLWWNEDINNRGNGGLLYTHGVPVSVSTVDTFMEQEQIPRIDFVKIDVEGMEEQVLRGGRSVWETFHPVLYFETFQAFRYRQGRDRFRAIEEFLTALGYQLFGCHNGKLIPVTSEHFPANTIAIAQR